MGGCSPAADRQALKGLLEKSADDFVRDDFATDPACFDKMSLPIGRLFLNDSRWLVSGEVLTRRVWLAEHLVLVQRRAGTRCEQRKGASGSA